ncbi:MULTISPECIES: diacylglycerol/polyprenol kinase family protein [Microcystis]|uniref:Phosphatidate cytidylyltransferase n=1 Tax=Microcystis aeruginosa NIES-298 TaxID=449468 RepID=A0A2H6BMA8_MICAE|nr:MULTISPECIES: diacylglycerol/polyprenol kinase family protein [Microcystis]MBE9245215.1 phosphatidate cytidylyltransferase [Microcystis aeruginosa LEGE 00239]MCZ8241805.1 SEC59/DGK1/VTE5 family protein [Microcystis sp. LE19-131.1A]MDB9394024.1 SEC59/DGK1/VTE5 family protein [Microcystis aeruginosa CS-573]QHU83040.1 phosphatidate cytidylyltransferase [Microcystis aeruginosa NIES-298]TYT72836.1 phosphatidate cytidylyltransferase [Microcystis aeruginosa KLA2]
MELSHSLLFSISLVACYLAVLILIAEKLKSVFSTDGEITRKVVHIGTGNVILFAWWLNIPAWVGISAAILAAIIAILSYFFPILPSLNSVGRRSWGTFFYAVSIGVLVAYFWPISHPEYAAMGILIMALGDGLAALVGQNFGQHPYKIFGSGKSLEGSLTMLGVSFLVSLIILSFVNGINPPIILVSLLTAIGATILETFSKLGIDNLTVPVGSAAIAYFLTQIFISS